MHNRHSLFDATKQLIYFIVLILLVRPAPVAADEPGPDVKTLQVNGYDMAYVERGSGTPLVLVHGSLSDYRTWLPLLDGFSESNRAIAVSLRHYYPEKWDGRGKDLSLTQHADDLAAFIQALQVGPVHVLGHSRGAAVALLMASKHPALVRRLVLADPTPLTTMLQHRPEWQAALKARQTKFYNVLMLLQDDAPEAALKTFVGYIAGPNAWANTPKARLDSLRDNQWTLSSLPDDMDTPLACSNLNGLSVPVMLVTGERSASIYGYMHTALQACLKQANKTVISDAGHMMFHANPDTFLFETQYFISEQ